MLVYKVKGVKGLQHKIIRKIKDGGVILSTASSKKLKEHHTWFCDRLNFKLPDTFEQAKVQSELLQLSLT